MIGLPPVTCKLALVSQLGLFLSAYFIILNDPVNLLIGFNLSMEDHSFLSILVTSLVITYLISLIGITLGKKSQRLNSKCVNKFGSVIVFLKGVKILIEYLLRHYYWVLFFTHTCSRYSSAVELLALFLSQLNLVKIDASLWTYCKINNRLITFNYCNHLCEISCIILNSTGLAIKSVFHLLNLTP